MNKMLLLSSGLDSFIAWHYLDKPPCLHLTGHSRYSWIEKQAVDRFMYSNKDAQVTFAGIHWLSEFEEEDANIPCRNLHFVSMASHYADKIYLVCQRGETGIPDRSPKFFAAISDMLTFLHEKPKKVMPVFEDLTKSDIVKWALDNGISESVLQHTFSCFDSKGTRCGKCKACARTALALDYNNILPDNHFDRSIWEWSGWKDYIRGIKDGKYEQRRGEQTKSVLIKRKIWRE